MFIRLLLLLAVLICVVSVSFLRILHVLNDFNQQKFSKFYDSVSSSVFQFEVSYDKEIFFCGWKKIPSVVLLISQGGTTISVRKRRICCCLEHIQQERLFFNVVRHYFHPQKFANCIHVCERMFCDQLYPVQHWQCECFRGRELAQSFKITVFTSNIQYLFPSSFAAVFF